MKNWDVNIKFYGNDIVEGIFFFYLPKKPRVIWRSRIPQRALRSCQPDHPKLPRNKMNSW